MFNFTHSNKGYFSFKCPQFALFAMKHMKGEHSTYVNIVGVESEHSTHSTNVVKVFLSKATDHKWLK